MCGSCTSAIDTGSPPPVVNCQPFQSKKSCENSDLDVSTSGVTTIHLCEMSVEMVSVEGEMFDVAVAVSYEDMIV